MADFLLELFSEEIPARMQAAAADQLRQRFESLLVEAGLSATGIEVEATPRRLALLAQGIPAASVALTEERRGPRAVKKLTQRGQFPGDRDGWRRQGLHLGQQSPQVSPCLFPCPMQPRQARGEFLAERSPCGAQLFLRTG